MALAPVEPGGELALVHHRGRHAVGRLVGPVGDDLDQALVAPPVRGSRGKAGDAEGNKNERTRERFPPYVRGATAAVSKCVCREIEVCTYKRRLRR